MTPGLEKLEMAEVFLESTVHLELPLYRTVPGDPEEENEARKSKQRWQKKKACHFLYAIVFELAIKIIWEAENGKECEHHHNILEFYTELSYEKQSKIKKLYERQASLIRTQEGHRGENRIYVDDLTEFQSLEDALEANYATVRDFKYDGLYQGKSSVIGGVIWNEDVEQSYIFPERFVIFPKELLKYARECVEAQTT